MLSLGTTLLIFLLVAFSLKVTGRLPRLALSSGILSASMLAVSQRVLICNLVRRTWSNSLRAELVIVDGGALPDEYRERDVIDAGSTALRSDLDDPSMLNRLAVILRHYDRVVISWTSDRKAEWAQVLKGANIQGEIIVPELGELGPLAIQQLNGVATVVVSRGP